MHPGSQTLDDDGDDYDGVGMGAILITSYVATFVLFLVWAFVQKDDLEKSTNAVAANIQGSQRPHIADGINDSDYTGHAIPSHLVRRNVEFSHELLALEGLC